MENQFWMCSFSRENDKTDINHSSETKVFLRYVDGTILWEQLEVTQKSC